MFRSYLFLIFVLLTVPPLKNVVSTPGVPIDLHNMAPTLERSASCDDRLESFHDWPPHATQTKESLAAAGFRYTNVRDKVKCDYCGGKLYNWRHTDDPVVEHLRYFPDCDFIKRFLEEQKGPDEEHGARGGDRHNEKMLEPDKGKDEEDAAEGSDGQKGRKGGAKRWNATEDWWRDQMERPVIQIVMNRGYAEEDVKTAVIQHFEETGGEFTDAATLLKAVFDLQDETEERNSRELQRAAKRATVETSDAKQSSSKPVASADEAVKQHQTGNPKQKKKVRKGRCLACEEKEQEAIFLPCGHLAVCPDCAVNLSECIVCHKKVQHRLRVYMA